jgi:hypothetical protein
MIRSYFYNLRFEYLLLPLFLFTASLRAQNDSSRIIGVKIYTIDGKTDDLISEWKELGINTAFVSREIAADSSFRSEAKEQNIDIFIIEPVFFNPEALAKDSTLYAVTNKGNIARNDWVEFVCPSNRNYRKKIINRLKNDVKKLDPEGISIDFIRHFLYWEMVKPDQDSRSIEHGCFCRNCIQEFSDKKKIHLPDSISNTERTAEYILNGHKNEWTQWKSDLITSTVREITTELKKIKPGLKFNLHAVPWRLADYDGGIRTIAGQDLSQLKEYVDYISPMCYSFMLYRNSKWNHSVVEDMNLQANDRILPSIQVREEYRKENITDKDFESYLINALRSPSRGVIFWSWEHLEKEPSKKLIIKNLINHL